MVVIISGPIGAGKTTFAKKNYEYVTDFDETLSKKNQIDYTLRHHREGKTVAHITCWPTEMEQKRLIKRLKPGELKMIWVDTDLPQCKENIIQRGRQRDLERMASVLEANEYILAKKNTFYYPWETVSPFGDE